MSARASGLLYTALTALLFRGLLPDITTHVFSDLGDPLLITSILAWNAKHAPLTEAWWNFPAFAPLQGVTAFTDHFLLTYPIASPIVWLTGNPVLAYNLVFLFVWPANALSASALARELTGSNEAAFIGGLAFGFAPYLAGQLSHLQMLLIFGMPLGLLGLHRYMRTGQRRDAVLFAAGWLATALANAYTLVFFPILVALWCIWFVRPREWKRLVAPMVAALIASIPLIPLLLGYQVRQAAFGLARSYGEAREWAADVTALAGISHREWLWSGWLPITYGESSIFPGLTIIALAVCAVAFRRIHRTRPTPVSRAFAIASVIVFAAALVQVWTGPTAWLRFRSYRAVSVAVILLIAAIFTSARVAASWRQRDPVMFYAIAAVTFWLLALGPEPTLAGQRILTYGPYRLFFELHAPIVVRVSARAWIAACPCLAVLSAFGTKWLLDRVPRHRRAVLAAIAALIVAESWFVDGTQAVPPPMPPGAIPQGVTVLDVPFNDPFVNAAAQYRAVRGGYRTINGYSGYNAPHLEQLQKAFKEHAYDALNEYRRDNLYVIVRPETDPSFVRWIESQRAERQSPDSSVTLYRLPPN